MTVIAINEKMNSKDNFEKNKNRSFIFSEPFEEKLKHKSSFEYE